MRSVQHVQAFVTAFAAVLADGSVVIWGNAFEGVTVLPCKTS